jgi:hypothetical protein
LDISYLETEYVQKKHNLDFLLQKQEGLEAIVSSVEYTVTQFISLTNISNKYLAEILELRDEVFVLSQLLEFERMVIKVQAKANSATPKH